LTLHTVALVGAKAPAGAAPLARKTRIALACLLACAARTSQAQSSATLFAIVDANVVAIRNGSATTFKGVGSDGLSSSRLGFRGFEDLVDGFKAGFWLEASVAPDTGSLNATRALVHRQPHRASMGRAAPGPRQHADQDRRRRLRSLRLERPRRNRRRRHDHGHPQHAGEWRQHHHAQRQPGELAHAP